ncbi:hypothetical protein PS1_013754 [Malus domestica]
MGQGVKASLDVGQNSSPTICWAKNHQAKHGRRVILLSNLGLKITKQNIAEGLSRYQILDWYPARFGSMWLTPDMEPTPAARACDPHATIAGFSDWIMILISGSFTFLLHFLKGYFQT